MWLLFGVRVTGREPVPGKSDKLVESVQLNSCHVVQRRQAQGYSEARGVPGAARMTGQPMLTRTALDPF